MYKKYQDIGKLYPLICKNKTLNIMKISILLLLFGIFSVSATGYSQEARVSITVNNTTINEVFTETDGINHLQTKMYSSRPN